MADSLQSPARNFADGDHLTPTFMNSLYKAGGHYHDGEDKDGHARKISLTSMVEGQLPNANIASGIDAAKITTGTVPAAALSNALLATDTTVVKKTGGIMSGNLTLDGSALVLKNTTVDTGYLPRIETNAISVGLISGSPAAEMSTIYSQHGSLYSNGKYEVSGRLTAGTAYPFTTLQWPYLYHCDYDLYMTVETASTKRGMHFGFRGELVDYLTNRTYGSSGHIYAAPDYWDEAVSNDDRDSPVIAPFYRSTAQAQFTYGYNAWGPLPYTVDFYLDSGVPHIKLLASGSPTATYVKIIGTIRTTFV